MAQVNSQKNLNRNISYGKMNEKAPGNNLNDMSATGSSSKADNPSNPLPLPGS